MRTPLLNARGGPLTPELMAGEHRRLLNAGQEELAQLGRGLTVFLMTLGMCGISGLLALRKVRSADPAEVFA